MKEGQAPANVEEAGEGKGSRGRRHDDHLMRRRETVPRRAEERARLFRLFLFLSFVCFFASFSLVCRRPCPRRSSPVALHHTHKHTHTVCVFYVQSFFLFDVRSNHWHSQLGALPLCVA